VVQLKDDCFASGEALLPLSDALNDIHDRVSVVVDTIDCEIDDCLGRVLAEDIVATRNVPPHDNSAVDGYALYHDDLNPDTETRLPFTGRIAAGHPLGRPAIRGEALQIFTGAPMPLGPDGTQASGPDTIFMKEDVEIDGDFVTLPHGQKQGANRRFAGEDIKDGDTILKTGMRLRAQELGLAASVGRATLKVYKPLHVAVFSTGDEVRDPSGDAPEGCIFDSNRFSIKGMLRALGCDVTDLGILPDDFDTIEKALGDAAGNHDLLVTSGGVSVGEEDHVKAAVETQGSLHMWRLAIKPGRPIALGQVKGTAFVGLPGNPVAAMVTFLTIARSMVLWISGADHEQAPRYTVKAGFDHPKKTGRREWVRTRLGVDGNGELTAFRDHAGGAGVLTSMVGADGLVELDEDSEGAREGAAVSFLPFSEVMR
jgi:molybdopterin molybdotransferase